MRTGSPRLGRGLMSCFLAHGIRLAFVLRHSRMYASARFVSGRSPEAYLDNRDLLDNVGPDWRPEDGGQRVSRPAGSAIGFGDGDCRTSRHLCNVVK